MDPDWHLYVSHQSALYALEKTFTMIGFNSLLLQVHPLEGWFFSSGKALVVLAVALILLIGFGIWMWRAETRLKKMEALLNQKNNQKG